ncbi:hypothetical protein WICPIJ_005146 [Wickerhamomyces pijperi]|uniref:Uncharacterized protein n=1 Tax=Wickerhamomyces pijperi TaxID=599730 RepID=A0A9P8TM89_WICPI|nr:hypothetical protein WICPIJ_005146 [Wickerhamomyces pijperi]
MVQLDLSLHGHGDIVVLNQSCFITDEQSHGTNITKLHQHGGEGKRSDLLRRKLADVNGVGWAQVGVKVSGGPVQQARINIVQGSDKVEEEEAEAPFKVTEGKGNGRGSGASRDPDVGSRVDEEGCEWLVFELELEAESMPQMEFDSERPSKEPERSLVLVCGSSREFEPKLLEMDKESKFKEDGSSAEDEDTAAKLF